MIEVSHLRKTFRVARRSGGFSRAVKALFHREYEEIHALDDVSFSIKEGEMVGYIGPNGAGKSSTIKVLSGILTPDSGECLVDGRTPWKDRIDHVRQSASFLVSAPNCGGTYRSSTPSSFCGRFTVFLGKCTETISQSLRNC